MKENKLIAEFMGYKFYNNLPQQRNGYQLPKDKGTAIYLAYSTSELQYHTSWDWLMPVVESIECLGYEFFIVEDRVKVSHNTDHSIETIIDLTSRSKLNATYNAVVEFINEYNKNK